MARFDKDIESRKRPTPRKPAAAERLSPGPSRTTALVTERLRKKIGVRRAISVSTRRGA